MADSAGSRRRQATETPIMPRRFSELEWQEGRPANIDAGAPGERGVARRAWLCHGEYGMHVQRVQMPPGNVVRPHSHNRDELMLVLGGSLELDGVGSFGVGDTVVIAANQPYGFVVGPDGLEFLIVRTGQANLTRH